MFSFCIGRLNACTSHVYSKQTCFSDWWWIAKSFHLGDAQSIHQNSNALKAPFTSTIPIAHIKTLTWLRDFRDKIAIFSQLHSLVTPRRDLDTNKQTNKQTDRQTIYRNMITKPRSDVRYVERGLFDSLETKRKLYKVNFRRDFWDRLLRRAVSYWRIFSVPEVSTKVNSVQFPSRF